MPVAGDRFDQGFRSSLPALAPVWPVERCSLVVEGVRGGGFEPEPELRGSSSNSPAIVI